MPHRDVFDNSIERIADLEGGDLFERFESADETSSTIYVRVVGNGPGCALVLFTGKLVHLPAQERVKRYASRNVTLELDQ